MEQVVVGFSKAQRQFFLEAYGNRCAFFWRDGDVWHRCLSIDFLECHHIYPRGFYIENMRENFNINGSGNGIVLCKHHHEMVHPDVTEARLRHRQGDKDAFRKMMEARRLLNIQGLPYWDTTWDLQFLQINLKFVGRYFRLHKDKKYPENRNRGLNGRRR